MTKMETRECRNRAQVLIGWQPHSSRGKRSELTETRKRKITFKTKHWTVTMKVRDEFSKRLCLDCCCHRTFSCFTLHWIRLHSPCPVWWMQINELRRAADEGDSLFCKLSRRGFSASPCPRVGGSMLSHMKPAWTQWCIDTYVDKSASIIRSIKKQLTATLPINLLFLGGAGGLTDPLRNKTLHYVPSVNFTECWFSRVLQGIKCDELVISGESLLSEFWTCWRNIAYGDCLRPHLIQHLLHL